MFWKKKTADEQVKADVAAITASLGPKWLIFCKSIPFKNEIPLSDRIESFATPVMAGILERYPSTKLAPPQVLWLMIFTAVRDSGTHSQEELNAAVSELQKRYAS